MSEKKDIINRLNRIEGQIRGITGMVRNDSYCVDIITQIMAVQAALNAVNRELLGNHIKNCVSQDIKEDNYSSLDEIIKTFQKLMK
ncbi:MAG: metal-sensing transcriptional repressor [Spirochaetaceae bacterium]|nr:metal-sensing transcriptional repressor [Spirochaetaceae bacterium]